VVQRLEDIRQEQSIEVKQDHMVMASKHGRQEGNICYVHMVMLWRKEVRKARRSKSFLFYLFLIESYQFVFLI